MAPRAPGLADVARRAGVSHQTVSRVINDHPNVSAATRAKVSSAIAELNYRRNMSARSLATGRTGTLGVVAPNTTLYGPTATVTALGAAAAARDLTLLIDYLTDTGEAAVGSAVARLLGRGVDGLLLVLPTRNAATALDRLVDDDLPVVVVDGPADDQHDVRDERDDAAVADPGPRAASPADSRGGTRSTVTVDQYAGAVLVTEHLLTVGAPNVWHVAGPSEWNDSRARERGWRRALTDAGHEPPPVLTGDWSPASGYRAGQFLARMGDCHAVFAANDQMALGVARALTEHGRAVGTDVLLAGFDDAPESAFLSPPLTTVRQDFAAVGRASLDVVSGAGRRDGGVGRTVLVAPELVIRASTGG